MHVIWYTAMSMDGRIAGPGNNLDFLGTVRTGEGEEAGMGFAGFLATIDAIVVGATTMRWLLDGGHGWPHDDIPTWLLSHDTGLMQRIGATRQGLHLCEGDIGSVLDAIEAAGHHRVWLCGGGNVAGQALAADRVDELMVTVAPTVLGSGPSLFDAVDLPARLFRLIDCDRAGSAAQLRWVREQRRQEIESSRGTISEGGHEWDADPAGWVRAQRRIDPTRPVLGDGSRPP